jgi:transposase-like protein
MAQACLTAYLYTAVMPGASDRDRVRALEREVKKLRWTNEILRKASAYFAQVELDLHSKW